MHMHTHTHNLTKIKMFLTMSERNISHASITNISVVMVTHPHWEVALLRRCGTPTAVRTWAQAWSCTSYSANAVGSEPQRSRRCSAPGGNHSDRCPEHVWRPTAALTASEDTYTHTNQEEQVDSPIRRQLPDPGSAALMEAAALVVAASLPAC